MKRRKKATRFGIGLAVLASLGLVASLAYAKLTVDDELEVHGGVTVQGAITGLQMPAGPGDPTDAASREFVEESIQQALQHVGPFGDLSMGVFVAE